MVTGANRGIGLEFVRQLLEKGAQVVATAREPEQAGALKELARSNKLKLFKLDVTNAQSLRSLVQSITELPHVDVLINNAGVYLDQGSRFEDLELETLQATFEVNTWGNFRVTQALWPWLKKSKQARVIQISSQMGSVGDNTSGGSYGYRMSKSALNMLARNLYFEDPQILSLCLHPGWVQTEMGGPNAKITTEEAVKGMLKIIENANSETQGRFLNYAGQELPW